MSRTSFQFDVAAKNGFLDVCQRIGIEFVSRVGLVHKYHIELASMETPLSHKTFNKLRIETIWRRNSKDLFDCKSSRNESLSVNNAKYNYL